MNITYLKYLFNKYKFHYLILLGLYFTILPLFCLFITNQNSYVIKKLIYFPVVVSVVLSYLIPLIIYRIYYFRNSANLYFSLPEKRQIILRTNSIFHLISSLSCFIIAFILAIMIFIMKGIDYDYRYFWAFLSFFLLISVSIYFFVSFICSICNSIFDAVILNLAYFILPALCMAAVYFAFNKTGFNISWANVSFIGAVEQTTKYYIQKAVNNNSNAFFNYHVIAMFVLNTVLYNFSFHKIKNYRQELIGEPTKSLIGYKLIIPLYTFLILLITNYQTGITFIVVLVILILSYILSSLYYNKKKKLDWKMLIEFLVLVILANILPFFINR